MVIEEEEENPGGENHLTREIGKGGKTKYKNVQESDREDSYNGTKSEHVMTSSGLEELEATSHERESGSDLFPSKLWGQ